ncbi:hypothetical protein [Aureimonas sp. Leaf324]|uniref:hypothetical protein n=1 Tax=Aureimonas sp. Leaf324 TaxID=1736336 RepID=UPI001FCE11CA|nr:hypothetical protein [Aureimonas sp. Leaf324]
MCAGVDVDEGADHEAVDLVVVADVRAADEARLELRRKVVAEGVGQEGRAGAAEVRYDRQVVAVVRVEGAAALDTEVEAGPVGDRGHHGHRRRRLFVDDVGGENRSNKGSSSSKGKKETLHDGRDPGWVHPQWANWLLSLHQIGTTQPSARERNKPMQQVWLP